MPFTVTHALAVLPVASLWRRVPLSALIIGSFMPDLPGYIPRFATPAHRDLTHSPIGLILVCLPASFFCYIVFQFLMKQPLFDLCPRSVQSRTAQFREPCFDLQPTSFALLLTALTFGAWTHICWDTFTHAGHLGTRLLPIINEQWSSAFGVEWHGWKVLQHGSSVIGLPLIAVSAVLWLRRREPISPLPVTHVSVKVKHAVLLFIAVAALMAAYYYATRAWDASRYDFYALIASRVILVTTALLALYSTAYHIVFWKESLLRNVR